MRAHHFLQADMTAGYDTGPAWSVGEERTIEPKTVIFAGSIIGGLPYRADVTFEIPAGVAGDAVVCWVGFHSCPTLYDALGNAVGPVACLVDVSEPIVRDKARQVSSTRRLLAAYNATRVLRLFACDCAEVALDRERRGGREPDGSLWSAVETARRYARGHATEAELNRARDAAEAAAAKVFPVDDAVHPGRYAAAEAAVAATEDAAWSAAAGSSAAAASNALWDAEYSLGEAPVRERFDAGSAAFQREQKWHASLLDKVILPKLKSES